MIIISAAHCAVAALLCSVALASTNFSEAAPTPYKLGPDDTGFVRYPEFEEPGAIYSDNGVLDVVFSIEVGRVYGPYTYNARLYNGTIPGPTLYVKPGDHLSITIVNNLGDQDYSSYHTNSIHDLNSTNLHTHGLHVPSMSDNVFIEVEPGENYTFQYWICAEHYPGTMIYHPHHHGSSGIQMYAGMAGQLIVLPKYSDFLDPFLKDIHFKVVFMQHIYAEDTGTFESIYDLAANGADQIHYDLEDCSELYNISDSKYNIMVNGQYQPVMTVSKNEWFGLRLTNAGAQYAFQISFPLDVCEAWVVARDGVYVAEAFQEPILMMFPGNRVDVVVRCTEIGIFPVTNVASDDFDWICGVEDYVHCLDVDTMVLLLNVEPSDLRTDDFPEDWTCPERPYYLRDLSHIPQADLNGSFEIVGGFSDDGPAFNDISYSSEDNYLYTMHAHGIYEFNLTMDPSYEANHPVHIHVNHFQIVGEYIRTWDTNYTYESSANIESLYKIGEFRDTVVVFPNRVLQVRMSTYGFSGTLVVHCHYLIHADVGMLGTILVLEGDGTTGSSRNAREYDDIGQLPGGELGGFA